MDKGVGVLCCLDEAYPQALLQDQDCPIILYYYGRTALLNQVSCAIVGSRRATAYGKKMAEEFASAFASAGLCVVSGMAKGIDAAAHEGALSVQGATIAVLGSGPDVPYPNENRKLYGRIREEGLILSEFYPGEKPLSWHFPLRNRIISGLSRFVLLAEAEARSGALITCDWAAEQGKDVWALPGPISNPYSIGPLRLIKEGAMMAISPMDILQQYTKEEQELDQQALALSGEQSLDLLSQEERALYQQISYYPVHINSLLANYSSSNGKMSKKEGDIYLDLTKLASLRLIEKLPGDYYQRV